MRKVSDVITTKPAFPEAEQVKVEILLNKPVAFKGFASRIGDKGDFMIVLVEHDKKVKSFSCGGKVVMNKLQQVADADAVEPDDNKVVLFEEPLFGKIIEQKSGEGRMYYDIIDAEATKK